MREGGGRGLTFCLSSRHIRSGEYYITNPLKSIIEGIVVKAMAPLSYVTHLQIVGVKEKLFHISLKIMLILCSPA